MNWEIDWTPHAQRDAGRLDQRTRDRIETAINRDAGVLHVLQVLPRGRAYR